MESQQEELILSHKKVKPVAAFNKQLLVNTYFEETDIFSAEAIKKLATGKYCGEIFGSKKYNLYWSEQRERCIHGFVHPQTKMYIPGYLYGFLNFKPMKILENPHAKTSRRITAFPRFWPIHYFYLQSVLHAQSEGLNNVLLKPRGTGFSELHSWIAASDYTFQKEDPSFFFVSNEGYLNKDGILSKCWENVDFLAGETERAFRHLRQVKNGDFHKRASYIDPVEGVERRTGGEIIGRIIDHPRKVRGARGKVFWEEGGSFPNLEDAWIATKALVSQGGTAFAMNMLWGTGGEQGPGIAGLEDAFRHPEAWDCLCHEDCWNEASMVTYTGFFFPTWASMDKYMDKWGNTDFNAAKRHLDEERERIYKASPQKFDKHIAEYPYTPDEALMRLTGNHFPVSQLQQQLKRVRTSKDIQGLKKHGFMDLEEGQVVFKLDPKARPINEYPHAKDADNLDGAITIVETPLKENELVPANLYEILVDPFYVDEPDEVTSLGSIYVYKKSNTIFPTEGDMLVAWYVGRPKRGADFQKIVFQLARYYNAMVNSEILGGGQNLLDYAKQHGFLNYCAPRPTMFNTDKYEIKSSQITYFINMNKDLKKQALQDLADWLLTERALKIDGEKTRYILTLELIYDEGLLEELIKFRQDANFDRISSLLILMVIRRELERQEIQKTEVYNGGSIFNRPLFTDSLVDMSDRLPLSEMLPPKPQPGIIRPLPGGDILF